MKYGGNYEEAISGWNDGNFLMARLDEIQTSINRLKLLPYKLDPQTNIPNYELLFNSLNALFGEAVGKYTDEEINEILEKKETIEELIKAKPPITFERKTINGKDHIAKEFHKEEYRKLMMLLLHYEIRIKQINDKHGFSTKNERSKVGL